MTPIFGRSPQARKSGGAPVVAVAAQKGGVGKTTTAVHLAWSLAAQHHRRVLLVDLDAQGHVGAHLDRHVHVETARKLGATLLQRRGDVREVAVPTGVGGLHITGPDKRLHQVEIQLNARIGKEMVLERALAAARGTFDIIVLDCPPNLGNLTVAALLAATTVLVPTDTSRLSMQGVGDLWETLDLLQDTFGRCPELFGVLLTRVDRRSRRYNAEVREELRSMVGSTLLDLEIPVRTSVSRAQAAGTTVFDVEPDGPATEAYAALAEALLEHVRSGNRTTAWAATG